MQSPVKRIPIYLAKFRIYLVVYKLNKLKWAISDTCYALAVIPDCTVFFWPKIGLFSICPVFQAK